MMNGIYMGFNRWLMEYKWDLYGIYMGFKWDPIDPDTSLEVEKFPVFNRTSLGWSPSFPLEVGSFFPSWNGAAIPFLFNKDRDISPTFSCNIKNFSLYQGMDQHLSYLRG
jgi:hypothetical protein